MEEEKYPIASLLSGELHSEMPTQAEAKARRRRRKTKALGDGDAEASEEGRKRRLSDEQAKFLEMNFEQERKLESSRKLHLAGELGLDPKQVSVWFQNRRARWKSKQLEEEYLRLRSSHDSVLIDKCRLENEVFVLKDKLVQSEEEIKRLSSSSSAAATAGARAEAAAVASSPSSSLTSATHLGEFGMEGDEMYAPAAYGDGYYYMMELGYLYGM